MDSALAPYRALDLTDDKGLLCGKILGDLGADVILVEPSGGNPARRLGPFYQDIPHPERSLTWWAFNTSKRSLTLDIESGQGRETFMRLVATADFVIESFAPGYLDSLGLGYEALRQINPGLILTSITPFGSTGPYRDFQTTDLVSMALGGQMAVSGDADRPPLRISTPQAYLHAGLNAAAGCLIALHYRERTGRGQRVEVSIHESIARSLCSELAFWYYSRLVCCRYGPCRPHGSILIRDIWPCRDGYMTLKVLGGARMRELRPLIEWMAREGQAGDLENIDWNSLGDFASFGPEVEVWQDLIGRFFRQRSIKEIWEVALREYLALMPNNTMEGVCQDEQLKARGFWVALEHPEVPHPAVYPGGPCHFSQTPWRLRSPAPHLGEHTQEVLAELEAVAAPGGSSRAEARVSGGQGQALADIKVADFAWVLTGPLTTKYLTDFGAQVIKIESRTRLDHSRAVIPYKDNIEGVNRAGPFHLFNAGKRSLALNLNTPQGREVAKRLVAWADVVTENFTPGTMEKWGLGYQELRQIKPDIIMLSSSIQGQTGPRARHPGYGWNLSGLAGFNNITGWADRDPVSPHTAYTDWIAPIYGALAILAAVDYKRRTGKGQYIDLSQLETGVSFLALPILDYTVNGRSAQRQGNRCSEAAPHNAYPCRGQDQWCAIAVESEARWRAFCEALGHPAWCSDPRFTTQAGRQEHEDELDKLVAAWTVEQEVGEAMARLQAAGVPAGAVQTNEDLLEHDPQLKERGFFYEVDHPEMGTALGFREPLCLEETPAQCCRAPLLGEDTEYVCRKILKMTQAEYEELKGVGVFE